VGGLGQNEEGARIRESVWGTLWGRVAKGESSEARPEGSENFGRKIKGIAKRHKVGVPNRTPQAEEQ